MFDIGFTEILLLSLVGLMVLGPERLPRVARTLGRMAHKARVSWMSLKRQVESEMRAEELKIPVEKFKKDLKDTVEDIRGETVGHSPEPPAENDAGGKADPRRD